MTSDFTLYTYFRSSTAYRARIALNLKGIKYASHAVHLLEGGGQQHRPEYRALNPAGGVPTLVHQGRALSQSFAIIEYLDDVYPQPPLFPADPFARAKVRQICEHINCEIHPITNLKVQQYLTKELGISETQKETWLKHWIKEGMDALEQLLLQNGGAFAFGDDLTAADIFLVPQVFSAKRFGITLEGYPHIRRAFDSSSNLDAFVKAHPHLQADTPSELFGKV